MCQKAAEFRFKIGLCSVIRRVQVLYYLSVFPDFPDLLYTGRWKSTKRTDIKMPVKYALNNMAYV
jgi:hypothetical protein